MDTKKYHVIDEKKKNYFFNVFVHLCNIYQSLFSRVLLGKFNFDANSSILFFLTLVYGLSSKQYNTKVNFLVFFVSIIKFVIANIYHW